jgi:hypothetical protein
VNSLGRGWRSCASALHDYSRAIGRVRRSARDERAAARARAELDRLQFELDVDVRAREGESGRARMTPVEAELLQPTLAAVRRALEAIVPRTAPSTWDDALADAAAIVRGAMPGLRPWQPHGRTVAGVPRRMQGAS